MQPELIAARSPLAYRCFHPCCHIICHRVPFFPFSSSFLSFPFFFPSPPSSRSLPEVITFFFLPWQFSPLLPPTPFFQFCFILFCAMSRWSNQKNFGMVTSSDAAAVACLNVITRMKGRILIKIIPPPTHTHKPIFVPLLQWRTVGCIYFFVIYYLGIFALYHIIFQSKWRQNQGGMKFYFWTCKCGLKCFTDATWGKGADLLNGHIAL